MPRPATGVTPVRNIRIGDQLWHAAQAAARDREETLTAVIERALRKYVTDHERAQRRPAQDEPGAEPRGTGTSSGAHPGHRGAGNGGN